MLTNPTLFDTVSDPNNGFKIPDIAYNPAVELRGAANLPAEPASSASLQTTEELPEGSPYERLIDTISERMVLQHQQLYLAFALCVIAF